MVPQQNKIAKTPQSPYFKLCVNFDNNQDRILIYNEDGKIRELDEPEIYLFWEITTDKTLLDPKDIVIINYYNFIENTVRANGRSPLHRTNMGSKTLSSFMAGYKSSVTKQINVLCKIQGSFIWQRNYYEHVIREDKDLASIREYIINNPAKWQEDEYYIAASRSHDIANIVEVV